MGSPANGPFDIDIIANMDGVPDGIVDWFGNELPDPQFNGASVTPERTTALLLVAGASEHARTSIPSLRKPV